VAGSVTYLIENVLDLASMPASPPYSRVQQVSEKILDIISRLEHQAERVSRFSHVASGTKELSKEMIENLHSIKEEVGLISSDSLCDRHD